MLVLHVLTLSVKTWSFTGYLFSTVENFLSLMLARLSNS